MPRKSCYEKRKEAGMCVSCGINKAMDGKVKCRACQEKHSEYQRKSREFFDSMGLCVRCGQREQAIGFKYCPECLEKSYEVNRRSVEKNGGTAKYYKARKANGKCVGCGNAPLPGHVRCAKCMEIHDKYNRLYNARQKYAKNGKIRRSERYEYGLCYICGESLDTDKRLCKKCTETMIENVKVNWHEQPEDRGWKRANKLLWPSFYSGGSKRAD